MHVSSNETVFNGKIPDDSATFWIGIMKYKNRMVEKPYKELALYTHWPVFLSQCQIQWWSGSSVRSRVWRPGQEQNVIEYFGRHCTGSRNAGLQRDALREIYHHTRYATQVPVRYIWRSKSWLEVERHEFVLLILCAFDKLKLFVIFFNFTAILDLWEIWWNSAEF